MTDFPCPAPRSAARGAGKVRRDLRADPAPDGPAAKVDKRARGEIVGKGLSKLSVVDHHFDQFGDLVAREVTRIGDKGLRIRRVDIRNSPFRSAVTSAGYNDVSERR